MIETVMNICFVALTISVLLALYRLAKGPTVLDRILSFDIITSCAVGMIILLSIRWRTTVFLELILIFTLLGFFGSIAFVFYLHRTMDTKEGIEQNKLEDR